MRAAQDEILTAEQLADHLQVRPSTIRLWAREGLIPVIRVGGRVLRFDLDDVLCMLKQSGQRTGTVPAA